MWTVRMAKSMPQSSDFTEHSAVPSTCPSHPLQTGLPRHYDGIESCHRHELAQTDVLGRSDTNG
mgnify:CR=1 FL=1